MDQDSNDQRLIKMLLTAEAKMGKTHYAAQAAAAGFNVLMLDGDGGAATVARLPLETRRNIYLLNCGDQLVAGLRDSRFQDTIREFTSMAKFRWNDTAGRIATRNDREGEIWQIEPAKIDHTCVLILDAWTGYVESLQLKCAREVGVDIQTATTQQMRPVYQMSGLRATALLQMFRAARCHVICIAHADEYQHTKAPDGKTVSGVKEGEREILWTKRIPKSTSRPHGLQMAKYFTDSPWMALSGSGKRQLDFRTQAERVGGGHFDGIKSVEEYSFANLVKEIGGHVPSPAKPASTDSWLTIIDAATQVDAPPKVLDGTKSTPLSGASPPKGFSGLGFAKKAVTAGASPQVTP